MSGQLGFAWAPVTAPTRCASLQPMRPYQEEAVAGCFARLQKYDDALWVMATGTGKTRCGVEVVRLWSKWASQLNSKSNRVLWLAERDELLTQAQHRMAHETGEEVGREQAEMRAGDERIVVASIQTLLRPQRLESLHPESFGLVIYDEVHHAVSRTRHKVINHFRDGGCKLLGVTATPDRHDEKPLSKLFHSLSEDGPAYVYEIGSAVSDGWLVDFDVRVMHVDCVDFSQVRKVRGAGGVDLAAAEVEAIICAEDALHGIADPTVRESGQRRVLGFTPGINSSKLLAGICDRYAHTGWARWIAGQGAMDIDERRRTLAAYERDEFRALWNCQVATEGFDSPGVSCLAMARPTMSRSLYAQMMGRGTRPVFPAGFDSLRATPEERRAAIAASSKPRCLLLEFTGNSGKHSLSCAADVFGEDYDEEVVEAAEKKLAKEGGSPSAALQAALKEAEELRLAAMAARARITANVQYRCDPFELMHMQGKDDSWAKRFSGDPATEKQVNYLGFLGVPAEEAKRMTKAQAMRMITTCKYREQYGKARFSQVAKMRAVGIDGFKLSYQQACQMCGAIQDARGKRPPEETIAAIMGQRSET